MSERDPLPDEFAALAAVVVTTPPGVEAARRHLRHRRRRLGAGAVVAVVLVAVTGFALLNTARHQEVGTTAALPTAGLSPRTPHAPVAPMPTVARSTTPSTPSTNDLPEADAFTLGASARAGCHPYGAVRLADRSGDIVLVRVDNQGRYPLCPGERVRVFWASYTFDDSGVQHLYQSQVSTLSAAHNPLPLTVRTPACGHYSLYIISGGHQIVTVIPAAPDFSTQATAVYYSTAAGPYGGVVDVSEYQDCEIKGPALR
jgi:hypothetical protein